MRYLAVLASAALVAGGLAGLRAEEIGESGDGWKLDFGAMTAAGRLSNYAMADGVGAGVAYEWTLGGAITRLGIRTSALDYDLIGPHPPLPESFQEYTLGIEALAGPSGTNFDPKLGVHVAYVRQDGGGSVPDADILDLGFDVMAALDITSRWGLLAVLTPVWLISEGDTDYRTRGALYIEFTIPEG